MRSWSVTSVLILSPIVILHYNLFSDDIFLFGLQGRHREEILEHEKQETLNTNYNLLLDVGDVTDEDLLEVQSGDTGESSLLEVWLTHIK